MSKEAANYLFAAAALGTVACMITYCASNWDDPPEWWPNALQSHWNKRDPVETEDKDKPEDEKTDEEVEQEQLVSEKQTVDVENAVQPVDVSSEDVGTDSKDVEIEMSASVELANETASV